LALTGQAAELLGEQLSTLPSTDYRTTLRA